MNGPLTLVRTDRNTGTVTRTSASGAEWTTVLRRVALAEGGSGTAEECAAVALRLIGGETITTAFVHYEVEVPR